MAEFVLALDPNPIRRRQFLQTAAQNVAPLPRLDTEHVEIGDLAIAWARGAHTPYSRSCTDSEFALLLGYAVGEDDRWLDAKDIARTWAPGPAPAQLPPDHVFDGYFTACVYRPQQELMLGLDPFGMFPLYYTVCDEALLASSSPWLFQTHPAFRYSLDRSGLAGILLLNGLMGNQSLLQGVRRVAAGSFLQARDARSVREVPAYRLSAGRQDPRPSFDEYREQFDDAMRSTIRRHRPPGERTVLLLSGGLDSRIMAGYLDQQGITDQALCLGRSTDMEVMAAERVTRSLQWTLHREGQEPPIDEFAKLSARTARWEQLSNGFGGFTWWLCGELAGELAPMCWSGICLDDILGGYSVEVGRDPKNGQWSGDYAFSRLNRWGLPPEAVDRLLGNDSHSGLSAELIENFREDYLQPELAPHQRGIRIKLGSRVRHHLACILHRLSFRSWPLLPALDRALVERVSQGPVEYLSKRRLEKSLARWRFADLARIPFDSNSLRFESLTVPRLRDVRRRLLSAVPFRRSVQRWYWEKWRGADPRRYRRFFDVDSAYWRQIRRRAEMHRADLGQWVQPDVLDELVPAPNVDLRHRDVFGEGASVRTLLGLMLWSADGPSSMSRVA